MDKLNLQMNNIFQYLYDKKGKPIPFEFKLLYKTLLNENDLIINGDLYLVFTDITSLPDNLTVNGSLYLHNNDIASLPDNLTVNGDLDISYTKIRSLPNDLIVDGDLYCNNSPLSKKIKKNKSLLIKYEKQIKMAIYYEDDCFYYNEDLGKYNFN